ncbi:hypothetical protein FDG2_3673 [Candidatus Protofrankia californiensis]|uniref:NAD-dependent epimerase/dehydratase n=1 Tax=Candidatus Protofrankia californiensis TaxID=1839754 RepID=A0A1C3P019_9ACTN|nr:hypothetical protein FDG2_3673 [Candidatus Protofrankia californiensis]
MIIAVTGVSGHLGSELVPLLRAAGHDVVRLVRREPSAPDEARWNPATGSVDPAALERADAVVHLAAENILGRWEDPQVRRRIRESRVDVTRRLAETLATGRYAPHTLVNAAAIGYYGLGHTDETLTEDLQPGRGFLAEIGRDREAAAAVAAAGGLRVVNVRIGVVQSPDQGMLNFLLPRFRRGLGGRIGRGRRYLAWVTRVDAARACQHVLEHPAVSGPVNAVSPNPVTNAEYARTLGRVLGRPAVLAVPPFVLRRALGSFAEETLLRSTRALPARLLDTGFTFRFPELETALRHVLAPSAASTGPDSARASGVAGPAAPAHAVTASGRRS